ncbi:acidic mammalian chitinase [Plakobranchus ocellatus]|uniref:Chitinase-3-like protein 1 n=1 Tax=Plakobranchus ocellatus TaxID=259542 RepID=A0AAV3Y5Z4_9GAST|nr:acidic mammalian chitinase [Plakobranchus ocellatus]
MISQEFCFVAVTITLSAVDYICLMAYDFHGDWDGVTGHMTSLYAPRNARGMEVTHNVHYAVNFWLQGGCPREKLVLGLAAYGRSYTLQNAQYTGLGEATDGPGRPGPHSGEAGTLAFYEVCSTIKHGGKVVWLEKQKVPFFVNGDQWVAYEDLRSIHIKSQYIRDMNLAGAMIWDISLDDFTGVFCGLGRFPLLTTIKKSLGP